MSKPVKHSLVPYVPLIRKLLRQLGDKDLEIQSEQLTIRKVLHFLNLYGIIFSDAHKEILVQ